MRYSIPWLKPEPTPRLQLFVCDSCLAAQSDPHRCTLCGFSREDERPDNDDAEAAA